MSRKKNKRKFKIRENSLLGKLVLVGILLFIVLVIFRYAGYFKREDDSELKIIIQNEVDPELSYDVYIDDNEIVYFSEDDIKKYFDDELYYEKDSDNMRRYFSISQNKILEITEDQNNMYVNGVYTKIKGKVFEKDGVYYFPISELSSVYNIEVDYLSDENRLNIEKLSSKTVTAVINKETKLKYKMTDISRTVKELYPGDTLTIIEEMNDKWIKVKTDDYLVGYVKKTKILDQEVAREELSIDAQYQDFDMTSDNIILTIDDSSYEDFSEKISSYDLRSELCAEISDDVSNKIVTIDLSSNIGVKVDISNVQNAENYYKFLKELKVYLNSNGCYLIVVNYQEYDKSELESVSNLVI